MWRSPRLRSGTLGDDHRRASSWCGTYRTGRRRRRTCGSAYETQYVINALLRISLDERSMEEVLLQSARYHSFQFLVCCPVKRRDLPERRRTATWCLKVAAGCLRTLSGKLSRRWRPGSASAAGRRRAARYSSPRTWTSGTRSVLKGCPRTGIIACLSWHPEKMLGVLSLCLEDGHPFDAYEQEFLSAVANALAGIIERKAHGRGAGADDPRTCRRCWTRFPHRARNGRRPSTASRT